MEAFRPDNTAWNRLMSKVGPSSSAVSQPAWTGEKILFRGEQELRQLIERQSFKCMGMFDLLLVIGHPIWEEIPEEKAANLAAAFWKYCANNADPGLSVYFWFFKNASTFHEILRQAARRFKGHPETFRQFYAEEYEQFADALFKRNGDVFKFCERAFVPLQAMMLKSKFRRSIVNAFWQNRTKIAETHLHRLISSVEPSTRKELLLQLCTTRVAEGNKRELGEELAGLIMQQVDSESLSVKAYFTYATATGQINFRQLKNQVSKTKTSLFVAYGFDNITDKHSDSNEIIFKRWLGTRLRIAADIQRHFKWGYLVTDSYYRRLFSSNQGNTWKHKCVTGSQSNFILFINKNNYYVCIGLPLNKGENLHPGAWVGGFGRDVKKRDELFAFNSLQSSSKWSEHIEHGPGWEKVLAQKLLKFELVEEKSVKYIIDRP